MITYHLSRAQAKQLIERGGQLMVALPLPLDDPPDLLAWARERLPDFARYVRSVGPSEVACCRSNQPDPSVEGLIGTICTDWSNDWPRWVVAVAVCHLAGDRPRHMPSRIQWPAEYRQ